MAESATERLIHDTDWSGTPLGPAENWSEALRGQLDLVLNSATPMALAWGRELSLLFNDAWLTSVGATEARLGRSAREEPTAPWPAIAAAVDDVLSTGSPRDIAGQNGRPPFRLIPVFGGAGNTSGVVVRTKGGLPRKMQWLSFGLEAGQLAIWDWDLAAGTLEWSPALYRLLGLEPGDVVPTHELWASHLHPEDRDGAMAAVHAARTEGVPYQITYRIIRSDGALHWCKSRGEPLLGVDGVPVRILGVVQDFTEHREALERQRALLSELQHRVRNNLAVIRSIVRRTAETSPDVEHFANHVEGRISALARVQSLLVRSPSGAVDLELLLREELLAAAADDEHVDIAGPSLGLTSKAGEAFSLTFNELVMNALKFGALGHNGGNLTVRWKVNAKELPPVLNLSWIESGLHLPSPPRSSGFGIELLTRTLPYDFGAKVSVEFPTDGFRCGISLPLTARVRR